MRVIITGGAGLIGSALSAGLAAEGHIENPAAAGPFNLSAPQAVTNAQLALTLGRVMRRPSWLPLSSVAMRAAFGEAAGLLLTGQRAVPRRLLEAGFQFRFPELEGALQDALA